LPEGVTVAELQIHSATTSITALLGRFILEEPTSLIVDDALRRDYKTRFVPTARGVSIQEPRQLKEKAVRDGIKKMVRSCFAWMTEGCAGSIATDGTSVFPGWVFVSLAHARPFADEAPDYLHTAGIARDLEAWEEHDDLPGIRLSPLGLYPQDPELMILGGTRQI
jgi:hypothetical protein